MHPCRIGALIGSGGSVNLDTFNKFAYYMGAAFQIQDDALNLEGEHERYGKIHNLWTNDRGEFRLGAQLYDRKLAHITWRALHYESFISVMEHYQTVKTNDSLRILFSI